MRRKLNVLICLLATVLAISHTARALSTNVVAAWLYAEARKQPISKAPGETKEELQARLKLITQMLAEEAKPYGNGTGWTSTELAAAAEVIWDGESLFDRRVHAGEQHPIWTQDNMLARCGMQLHASGLVPADVWTQLGGVDQDATRLCAKYGTRVVVAMARQCGVYNGLRADRNRVAITFASYASGGKCKPDDRAWQRADRWLKMMASRPDHEKKTYPGYRRAAPGEIPPAVRSAAEALLLDVKESKVHVGSVRDVAPYKLVVEHHAEGKTGVSVLVAER